jgi:hypothetical protein
LTPFGDMVPGLDRFLEQQPYMSIKPGSKPGLVIEGKFCFSAESPGCKRITDNYELVLEIPERFPKEVPRATECGYRIPRTLAFHVNADGSLCLGSPLRLLLKLAEYPSLPGFASKCLVPYLYAISHKLKYGGKLLFGELGHGAPGELADYADLFGLQSPDAARRAWELLRMKKRIANKRRCPCGCGRRLGKCDFNWTIRKFRRLLNRARFSP